MEFQNPLRKVATLLGQFTTLQDGLKAAVEKIRDRRNGQMESIAALNAQVAKCDSVEQQAVNAIKGIDKLLGGE